MAWMESTEKEMVRRNVFGAPQKREAVINRLKSDNSVYRRFVDLSDSLQDEMVEFCMGVRGVKVTYDPFFKFIFDTAAHPDRLETLISLCLEQKVEIVEMIPNESKRIVEEGSLMVMDIVVRLESGALVNVEIQRFGYMFPGARCACYSSDLMMRQYSEVRARMRRENRRFSYQDIKKVYTIVIMQKSPKEFHKHPGEYLHHSRQVFNTGLEYDMLQEYVLIPLDIFLEIPHNKLSRLDAWLYFIGSDKMEDIRKVTETYPEFNEIYREIFQFRYHVEELVSMFSEALRILDVNTTQYMIEEQQKEIESQRKELEGQKKEIEGQKKEIDEAQKEIDKKQQEIESQQKEIARLRALLGERDE